MKTPEGYEKDDIDKYLVAIGAFIVKTQNSGYGISGHSDRYACIEGQFWGIEVKREGKGPTVLQTRRMEEIEAAKGLAVAGTAEVVISAIEAWRTRQK
jgi:hypothetical protein